MPGFRTYSYYSSNHSAAQFTEETVMAKLINEYTDRKNIRHTVKHCTLSGSDPFSREQIMEEIRNILIKQAKKTGEA